MTKKLDTEGLYALITERDRAFMDEVTRGLDRKWVIAKRASRITEGRHVITPGQLDKRRVEWERRNPVLLID